MYICICNQVNDRAIRQAVRNGARNLDDLIMELDIATCCGKCSDDASRVLEHSLTGEHLQHALELTHDAAAVA